MEIITSYKVKILDYSTILRNTIRIYRDALDLVIRIVELEWDLIKLAGDSKHKKAFIEKLIHRTKTNPTPEYNMFDVWFYKFPSYLRRAVISEALGIVSSYMTRLSDWEKDKVGVKPCLKYNHIAYPCFYNKEMFKRDGYTSQIKVYIKGDWVWLDIKLRKSDIDYLDRHKAGCKWSAPSIERIHKRYYLRFMFKEVSELVSEDKIDKVMGIDLGVGTDATCSVMDMRGTVLDRKFINFPREKDLLYTNLNRIKSKQSTGTRYLNRMWRLVKNENLDLTSKIANEIIKFAIKNKVDVIVFEHLDFKGKKRGPKEKLHHWKHKHLINMITTKAHLLGIRISTVNAKNTSKLAFDGSGEVKRGYEVSENTPYSIGQFTTGKMYNVDLSASYNIGARYIIRYRLKTLTEKERFLVEAKVPLLKTRTLCTLSTLVNLVSVLDAA